MFLFLMGFKGKTYDHRKNLSKFTLDVLRFEIKAKTKVIFTVNYKLTIWDFYVDQKLNLHLKLLNVFVFKIWSATTKLLPTPVVINYI